MQTVLYFALSLWRLRFQALAFTRFLSALALLSRAEFDPKRFACLGAVSRTDVTETDSRDLWTPEKQCELDRIFKKYSNQ